MDEGISDRPRRRLIFAAEKEILPFLERASRSGEVRDYRNFHQDDGV